MSRGSTLFAVVVTLTFAVFLPVARSQLRLEFAGSTEIPSLKCVLNPGRFDIDVNNRTVCFCVMIQGSIPTFNCIRADGKVTMEDLENLVGTIRNLTSGVSRPMPTPPSFGNGNVPGGLPNPFGNRNSAATTGDSPPPNEGKAESSPMQLPEPGELRRMFSASPAKDSTNPLPPPKKNSGVPGPLHSNPMSMHRFI